MRDPDVIGRRAVTRQSVPRTTRSRNAPAFGPREHNLLRRYLASLAVALSSGACAAEDVVTAGASASAGTATAGGQTGSESSHATEGSGSGPGGNGGPADHHTSGGADATTSGVTTADFIENPDAGGVVTCDIWGQDCTLGEKCMPWANDGGGAWNATRCSPLDPNPVQPGDACTVEGSGVSGIDNCDLGSMCWDVDPETNTGTCVAFCKGTEAAPVCEDPSTVCVINDEGSLIPCLPVCHPLLQDCAQGLACFPSFNGVFACFPDVSGEMGGFGDACDFINVCDPGLFCADAATVPNCDGSSGCCSAFCDMSDPDASMNCPGAADGQECVAWFADGHAPPGFENVGACAIPM